MRIKVVHALAFIRHLGEVDAPTVEDAQATKPIIYETTSFQNEVIEVDDKEGERLVKLGAAEEVDEDTPLTMPPMSEQALVLPPEDQDLKTYVKESGTECHPSR